jgi:hypothetical protein
MGQYIILRKKKMSIRIRYKQQSLNNHLKDIAAWDLWPAPQQQ